MSRVSIVVPVFHNAASLAPLLERLQALAARNPQDAFEFVFVNDGSTDNSQAVLESLASTHKGVQVVKLTRNFGSNAAIMAGMAHASGEVVGAIAADLQDPPELIHDMLELWRQGKKVVLAERQSRDDPFLSTVLANVFYALFRKLAIAAMPKHGFDFFLLDRQVVNLINGIQESNAYIMGLILWLGFQPATVAYHRSTRLPKYGVSMWSLARRIKYFIDALVAFSYVPIRASSLMGILLSACGLIYAVIIIVMSVQYQVPVQGWSSMMVVILLLSGAQMVMVGVLGEYVWRNLEEARKRPRFIVEHVQGQPPAAPPSTIPPDRTTPP